MTQLQLMYKSDIYWITLEFKKFIFHENLCIKAFLKEFIFHYLINFHHINYIMFHLNEFIILEFLKY